MAGGEYVSVSSQRDTERAMIAREAAELAHDPKGELQELIEFNQKQGMSESVAKQAALDETKHDALAAHANMELKLDPEVLTNPWQAALASAASFTVGAIVPLIAIANPNNRSRVPLTFASVIAALIITGTLSANAGGAKKLRATTRVVLSGLVVMAVTFLIGHAFKISGV